MGVAEQFNESKKPVINFLELEDDISITEVRITSAFDNKTIGEINFRVKYNLNVIAITEEEKTTIEINANTILKEGNELVVVGKNDDIAKFTKLNV